MATEKETNVWAILGLVFAFICQILGIVFSIIALHQIKENPEKYKGRELALAGLIASIVMIIIGLIIVVIIFSLMFKEIAMNPMMYNLD